MCSLETLRPVEAAQLIPQHWLRLGQGMSVCVVAGDAAGHSTESYA